MNDEYLIRIYFRVCAKALMFIIEDDIIITELTNHWPR